MKKSFKWFALTLLLCGALALCSCDLIDKIASDLESANGATSSEVAESSKETAESSKESETEPQPTETETQAKKYTLEDFVGVWQGSTESKTTIVLKSDMTLMYYEFGNPFYAYNKGREANWEFTEDGKFTTTVLLSEEYDLSAQLNENEMYLEATSSHWTPETVKKTDLTELEVEIISADRCSVMLPDGEYTALGKDGGYGYTDSISIKDGWMTVKGDVKQVWMTPTYTVGDTYSSTTGEFVIPVGEKCEFYTGGEYLTPIDPSELSGHMEAFLLECNFRIERGYVVFVHHHQ